MMRKKIISIILCVLMLMSASLLPAFAQNIDSAPTAFSGSCGEKLNYSFDEETGTLTISGEGAMTDFAGFDAPWRNYRSSINFLVIEDGVTTLGVNAFEGCTALESVEISDTVVVISEYCFYLCSSLTSVVIPDSVVSVGGCAFYGCIELETVTIGENVQNILPFTFDMCTKLKEITIPASVENIERFSFNNCENLSSVTISDGVKSIDDDVFNGCPNITSIIIPESVESIGRINFSHCIQRMTIYCFVDSYAHTYALERGIQFKFNGPPIESLTVKDGVDSFTLAINDTITVKFDFSPSNCI